jgi:hypothetical protein
MDLVSLDLLLPQLAPTVPFVLDDGSEQVHWDVPLAVAQLSPLWRDAEPDQLPLVVECSAAVFAELLQLAESRSWAHCAQPDAVQLLAQRYQIQLPDPLSLPEPLLIEDGAIGAIGSDAEQLLESLFLADDALLRVYAEEPLLSAGVRALLCANAAQALLAIDAIDAIASVDAGDALDALLRAQPAPLHPLLARRLALLGEQLCDRLQRSAEAGADSALLRALSARKREFFGALGQYE